MTSPTIKPIRIQPTLCFQGTWSGSEKKIVAAIATVITKKTDVKQPAQPGTVTGVMVARQPCEGCSGRTDSISVSSAISSVFTVKKVSVCPSCCPQFPSEGSGHRTKCSATNGESPGDELSPSIFPAANFYLGYHRQDQVRTMFSDLHPND